MLMKAPLMKVGDIYLSHGQDQIFVAVEREVDGSMVKMRSLTLKFSNNRDPRGCKPAYITAFLSREAEREVIHSISDLYTLDIIIRDYPLTAPERVLEILKKEMWSDLYLKFFSEGKPKEGNESDTEAAAEFLPAECHNNNKIDGSKALDLIKGMFN